MCEDGDIKIFTKKTSEDKIDEVALIAEMDYHRGNGNMEKAKQLGAYLSSVFVDEEGLLRSLEPIIGNFILSRAEVHQIEVLMAFSAEYIINRALPNALLSGTAVNSLYDSIIAEKADLYAELKDGAEYSFYYLAVRKGMDTERAVGEAYAMLCGKEGDAETAALGTRLFTAVLSEIENIIEVFDFVQ